MVPRKVYPTSLQVHDSSLCGLHSRVHDKPGLVRVTVLPKYSHWRLVSQSTGTVQMVRLDVIGWFEFEWSNQITQYQTLTQKCGFLLGHDLHDLQLGIKLEVCACPKSF